MIKFLNWLLPHKEIVNCEGDLYLRRWYLFRGKTFSVFIHKFERSDEDRALHDHPWAFLVIPIWRGYIEHYDPLWSDNWGLTKLECSTRRHRVYPIIGTRYRPATFQHRVELLKAWKNVSWLSAGLHGEDIVKMERIGEELPAWSIFIHFKREREWGFQMPDGWISQKKWWSENCVD